MAFRYRKLSRDVPQSRWDVDAKVAEGIDCKPSASDCDLMDTGELKRDEEGGPRYLTLVLDAAKAFLHFNYFDFFHRVRKGRNSVEEIILDSIATVLEINVSNLKMHGCGREDIDVRMLGMS